DRVEVAGEVQVDVLHRHDLRVATAGCAAFHAEDGSERRLAQADHRFLADVIERIAQAHGGGRLALARGRGRHRRHQDQLRVRTRLEAVQVFERHLSLEMPVGLEVLFGNAELRKSDLGNALELGFLCDFDVGGHLLVLLLRDSITLILWARHYKGCAIARTLTEIKIQAALRKRKKPRFPRASAVGGPSETTLSTLPSVRRRAASRRRSSSAPASARLS